MGNLWKWVIPAVFVAGSAANAVYQLNLSKPVKEQRSGSKRCILCIGDSITFGAGVRTNRQTCWVRRLEALLGGDYQVLNYGISGATLQKEGDQPYDPSFWQEAKAQKPETVILMLGTNDSKPQNWNHDRYKQELMQRLEELENWETVERILVMLPPWCCGRKPNKPVVYKIKNEVIRDEICPIIREAAAERGIETIDLYSLTEGHPEYFGDGVHPNELGNRVIAEKIRHFLKRGEYRAV